MSDIIRPEGVIYITIEEGGVVRELIYKNKVLRSGRSALAKALANDFGSSFEYFITGISFGSGGTSGGTPRTVTEDREGLFGTTVITKSVISSINEDYPTTLNLTTVLGYDDANGSTINEMALKMRNGDFFSMATFSDLPKTSSHQYTFKWQLNFV